MIDFEDLPPGVVAAQPVTNMNRWQRMRYDLVTKTITRFGYARGYIGSAYQYGLARGTIAFATSVQFVAKDEHLRTASDTVDHLKAIQEKAKAGK